MLGYHTDYTFWSGVEIAFICGAIHYFFFWRVRCFRLKCTFIYGIINLCKRIMRRWMETYSFFPNLFGAYDDQNYCLHCLIFWGEECYRLLLRPLLKMINDKWCMKFSKVLVLLPKVIIWNFYLDIIPIIHFGLK